MEPTENEAVAAFDTLYTNNHIQILKVLLPYFDFKGKKQLAVLIKFMELRYTMDYFSRHSALDAAAQEVHRKSAQPDIVRIFEQIKNFCTPSERAMFDQLANMKRSMEMYDEMMGMMQMFSQLMPESENRPDENAACAGQPECAGQSGYAYDDPQEYVDQQDYTGQQEYSGHSGSDRGSSIDPRGQNANPFGNANPMDMLKGMLSPEQQAMFEMFQGSFGNTNE